MGIVKRKSLPVQYVLDTAQRRFAKNVGLWYTQPSHDIREKVVIVMVDYSLIRSVELDQMKESPPEIRVGDTVKVHNRIVEGNRERVQVVQGTVMRLRKGGLRTSFTVRRTASHAVGVERTFLLHSPRIEKIEVIRHGYVRRAQLYFLRGRKQKAARLREKR